MKYDDLDIIAIQLLFIMGAFVLGALLGSRDRRSLPPPDPKTQRNRVSYL
jgi:hypothetical protein